MINKPKLAKYNNDRLVAFLNDVVQVFERDKPEALANAIDTLKARQERLRVANKVEKGSELTPAVQQADSLRDQAVRGLKGVLEGYAFHYDAPKKTAAERLLQHLKRRGKRIDLLPMVEQTTAIEGVLEDWGRSEEAAAVDLLGLHEWAAHLKGANGDFQTTYLERVENEAGKAPYVAIIHQRPEVAAEYEHFHQLLVAHRTIDPATYGLYADKLNELVERYNGAL